MLLVAATDRELASAGGAETLCCGIGPVEAAIATARALSVRRPRAVVNIGVAGARTVAPPALVVGSGAVYCDLVDRGSMIPRIARVDPDPRLLATARRVLPEALLLPIATSGRVGGGTCCDIEAMEGFAVLRAAALAGIPAIELRAVSNLVDDDRRLWAIDDALALLAAAVPLILEAFGA